jgi:glycosyltransferase involved in cell wall biosynthesis
MYGSDRMFLESVAAMPGRVLAVVPGEGPLAEALRIRGIPLTMLDFPVLRKVELRSPLAALRFGVRFLLAVPRLAHWLRRRGGGLVYVSTVIAPVWILAGRLASRRVVCHVHESEPAMSRMASRVLLLPLRMVHTVIVNSRDTCQWVVGSTGHAVAARTRVVYNGVSETSCAGRVPHWGAEGEKRLVVVGRLSDRKGQDVAIHATALLRAAGHDVGLSIVGDCFPGYESVEKRFRQLVRDLGITRFVSFEGYQDPSGYVEAADVVLVPSRNEPFGLVAVESLLRGRPTVASGVGGLKEIIDDGRTGRLVVPGDPAAVTDAVAELLADPRAAHELGRRGRADVRQRFSMAGYAERLCQALSPQGDRLT